MFSRTEFDAEFDFHQFDTITPEEVGFYVDRFIEDSVSNGDKKLLLITGNGKIIKPHAQTALKKNRSVKAFKQAGYHSGRKGAFEITLV
jgi:DNA-nicking Smr family endonuclease